MAIMNCARRSDRSLLRGWRAKLGALMPHPEARDFSDIFSNRGYVEVAVNKGVVSR
jgi:hypothetical protein